MSQPPFGFSLPSDGGDDDPGGGGVPDNPFAAFGFGSGTGNPADIGAAFTQLGRLLSYEGGPVNWDLARDLARQGVAATGEDRSVGAGASREVAEALRLAEHWLDEATALPSGVTSVAAWSRAEWVEATLPAWKTLVEPVAGQVGTAMQQLLNSQLPEEMAGQMQAMAGPLQQMMNAMGGAVFGAQLGQALSSLASEVVGSTDVGLPLGPTGVAALLPANVTALGEGLGVPLDEVRLFLALREAAHVRLYAHVPWLRSHVVDAIAAYGRGLHVDPEKLQEAVGRVDPSDPEALMQAMQGGMFEVEESPAQQAALARLETALALVEGWVDAVVAAAAHDRLPGAGALRETLRRRRAAGGPAEETFATLVGLELRPRRLREAAQLWELLREQRGIDGRDAVWAHPDLVPSAADLDDPAAFVQGGSTDAFDLSSLEDAGPAPSGSDGGDAGDDGPAPPSGRTDA